MVESVAWHRDGQLGLVTIDNPPVNAAGHAVRQGLIHALDKLEADPEIEVIVLYGVGRTFVAGADIREFGKTPQPPLLPEVCNRIERTEKPVVAVLHGTTLGGGLEIALSAHLRVAQLGTKLGFPEVKLGILPGAGGTQRAPRLIGVAKSLDLIVSGNPIDAQDALQIGLVDQVFDGPVERAALASGKAVLAGTLKPRVTAEIPVEPEPDALDKKRTEIARTTPHLFSPLRCVEAVEAAELPLDKGLARERDLFNACLQSPQRAGLVHAFFAEREVRKIPEQNATPIDVKTIGVVGAGTMGRSITATCLIAGYNVVLVEQATQTRDTALVWIDETLSGAQARGKISDAVGARSRLVSSAELSALSKADLVIEAVPEDMALKQEIFSRLSLICPAPTVLTTNTSYLDIDMLAQSCSSPDRMIGLHFFAPAHIMKLLEIVVGAQTRPDVVATGFAIAKQLGKVPVRSGVCDGFIGNRILAATRRAADEMVMLGAHPYQVDAALEEFGFAMGPYAAQDLSGLDIGAAGRRVRNEPAALADALIERGAIGKKAKTGFYHYGETRTENPDLEDLISAARADASLPNISLGNSEIQARYLAAMVAEGCRILDEGIALRAVDIDAVLLFGYGFPRHLGGPMHQADQIGLPKLVDQILRFQDMNPVLWSVPDLLRNHAAAGLKLVR